MSPVAAPAKHKRTTHKEGGPYAVRVCGTLPVGDVLTRCCACSCMTVCKEVESQEGALGDDD